MNKLMTLGVAVLCTVAFALPAGAQFLNIPAGPIKMDLTSKPVLFDHNVHTSQDCATCHTNLPAHFPPLMVDSDKQCAPCHHPVAGMTPKFRCGTSGCHDPKEMQAERSYYKIVHDRTIYGRGHAADSCLGCHSDVVKTRPERKQALTGCSASACHPAVK